MRRKKQNKIYIFIMLLLFISIGYAALSNTLKINGSAGITKNTWSVYWDNVVPNTNLDNASILTPATIRENDTTQVDFSVVLNLPGDFYEFTVDAVNAGSLDAMIGEIKKETSQNLPEYISYTVTYEDGREVAKKHILPKGDTSTTPITPTIRKYKIRVYYDPDKMTGDQFSNADIPCTFSYKIAYVQADETVIDPDSITVTLDANGGTLPESEGWTGSGSTATKELSENASYGQIPTPTKSGYRFLGWVGSSEASETYSYEELEYIESTGTQYIDIEYIPRMNTKIELDMKITGSFKPCSIYQGSNIIFGVADQNNQWFSVNFGEESYQGTNMFVWNDSVNDLEKSRFDVSSSTLNNRNTFILDTNKVTYGEYTKDINPKNGDQLTSMYLFGSNSKEYDYEGPFTSYNMTVYGLKIYENNTLVRDYVPAINTTTKHIGMYEKITNRFVGNIGTNEFKTTYTTSSSKVKSKNNHKLIAMWEEE